MILSTIKVMMLLFLLMSTFFLSTDAGDCFTELGDEYGRCRINGRFKSPNYTECCSYSNATGYTESTSWIVFPEYLFNRKRAQTSCQTCSNYLNQISISERQWCFAVYDQGTSSCVHEAPFSAMLPANDKLDCCLWYNASGYTSAPNWQWSRRFGRWVTTCNTCHKEDLVTCYESGHEANGKFVCTHPHARMTRTSLECCNRKNAKSYETKRQCFPCPVNGKWSPWSVWSPCSTTCGNGQMRRLRLCDNPAPRYGGRDCYGSEEQLVGCNNTVQCSATQQMFRYNVASNGQGTWSLWTDFESCSVTCGNGSWSRRRICLNPDNNLSNNCQGTNREVQMCQNTPCLGDNSTYAEGLQSWSPWSPCSITCGIGIRKRSTICTATNSSEENSSSQTSCAETTELSLCEQQLCPVPVVSNPGVPIAWAVASLAVASLIIGFLILFCQKRSCYRNSRWCHKHPEFEIKSRTTPGLPPLPEMPYSSTEDIGMRYTIDSGKLEPIGNQADEEGYEIPRNGSDCSKTSNVSNVTIQSDLPNRSSSNMAINHVYEQLEFNTIDGRLSVLLPSATSTDSKV